MALIEENKLITIDGASKLYNDLRDRIKTTDNNVSALNTDLDSKVATSFTINEKALTGTGITLTPADIGISKAFNYKGSYANIEAFLRAVTSPTAGDVYNIESASTKSTTEPVYQYIFTDNNVTEFPAGTNFVWSGTKWDALGGSVDLSGYATTSALTNGLSGKQDTITGAASSITDANLTTGSVLVSDGSGKVSTSTTTDTELSYLKGVTSSVQTQLDGKAPTTHGVHVRDVPFTTMPTSGYYLQIIGTDPATASFTWGIPSKKELGIEDDIKGILEQLGEKADQSELDSLAKVATSGSYNDLIDKPTIDSALSTTSTNAVQNKVVDAALKTKANSADVYTKTEVDNNLSGYVQGSIATAAEVRSYFNIL